MATDRLGASPSGSSKPVRLSSAAYGALVTLAAESGQPMVRCLNDLVQDAYRRGLWARFAEANRLAESDPRIRAADEAEDAIWSVADADGLDPDEGVHPSHALEDAASW